jgi:hypothetical protein
MQENLVFFAKSGERLGKSGLKGCEKRVKAKGRPFELNSSARGKAKRGR